MFRRVAAVGARIPWGGADDDTRPDEASTDRARTERQHGRPDPGRTGTVTRTGTDTDPRGAGGGTDDPRPFEAVAERETLADVVDAAALTRWLPAAWAAETTVTKFGEDAVTEVLELSGRGHRLVVDPERTVAPEGPATCYERPAGTTRRRAVATTDSLHEALAVALDRITSIDDQVDPVMPAARRGGDLSDVLASAENRTT